MALRFLSQDWCAAAMAAANANPDLYDRFADPATFDQRMALGLPEAGPTTYATFEGARLTAWTSGPATGAVDFALRGRAEYFVELAEGTVELGALLVAGKLAVGGDDPRPALRNLRALAELLRTFDRVDTDWDA